LTAVERLLVWMPSVTFAVGYSPYETQNSLVIEQQVQCMPTEGLWKVRVIYFEIWNFIILNRYF